MAKQLNLQDNTLHSLTGGLLNQRRVEKLEIQQLDFEKITLFANELNSKLHDKKFLEQNLYLFGENYEHNTDDDLLNVLGWKKENYVIETGNLVGYICLKGLKLNITSRFGDNFLKYLLCYSDGFLELPDTGSVDKNGLYEWVLIYLWKKALMKAYRLGVPKQYIPQSEKRFTLRGNIDVLNYAVNKGMEGKILCHYYQHGYNNPVTQLVAYTFARIKNKQMIADCMQLKNTFENCVEGKRGSMEASLSTKPITNPYYAEYNKVIWLSKKILQRQYSKLSESENVSSSFLFDMSMLFEYFIRRILIEDKGLKLFPKNDHSMSISRGLGKGDDRNLYPDIIIDRGEEGIEVYDVKYKFFNTRYGIKREDLFQLHTYVSYLSNYYRILKCGIIYPQEDNDKKIENTNNILRHPNYENGIPLNVIFLNIPSDDENNYKGKMDESKYVFLESF